MKKIKNQIKQFLKDEEGQALSEYALILAIIVIAVIAVLIVLRDKIVALFQKIADSLTIS